MTKAVAAGMAQGDDRGAAAARQARVDRGEDVIVGVNKYRLAPKTRLETLEVDNAKVREGQIARHQQCGEGRDEARARPRWLR
jgi:methylmalonyl-CoA mutase